MEKKNEAQFLFWIKYLKFTSIFFALMGTMWAVLGSFDPIGFYDSYFAKVFWNLESLPPDAELTKSFLLGPFGATSAGYFILQYFIAKNAYAKKELWGYQAIIYAFSFWFILDTAMSWYHGAYFNIMIANIPCLFAMLPIFFTKKYFTS